MLTRIAVVWSKVIGGVSVCFKLVFKWIDMNMGFAKPEKEEWQWDDNRDKIPPMPPVKPVKGSDKELKIGLKDIPVGDLYTIDVKEDHPRPYTSSYTSRRELKEAIINLNHQGYDSIVITVYTRSFSCLASTTISIDVSLTEVEVAVADPLPRADFSQ